MCDAHKGTLSKFYNKYVSNNNYNTKHILKLAYLTLKITSRQQSHLVA